MGIEIERKFLVSKTQWKTLAKGNYYRQGYLIKDPQTTVRVRVVGEMGFLTLKGKVENLARPEFEYPIPVQDAEQMLALWCRSNVIEKYRYRIPLGNVVWEVDEFLGANTGLVIAEVELQRADQPIVLPDWIGEEVSGDVRYYNSYLITHPYQTWQTQ